MTYRARWSMVMTILGLVTAVTVFAATGSVGWASLGFSAPAWSPTRSFTHDVSVERCQADKS